MPFTNTIVDFINDHLKDNALNRAILQPAKFYNVASQVPKKDDPAVMFPGVIDESGEIEGVHPDDLYNLSIYHKVVSNTYTGQKKGYGDGIDILSITEMQAFVFAQSDRIKMTAEALEPFIRCLFSEGSGVLIFPYVLAFLVSVSILISPCSDNHISGSGRT